MRRINSLLSAVLGLMTAGSAMAQGPGSMHGTPTPSFRGHEGLEMNFNLVVPQVAVGARYTTSLVLFNLGNPQSMGWVASQNLKTTGKVFLFKQDGTRLAVGVNGGTPATEFAFTIDPQETLSYELSYSGADTSGWALIQIDDPSDGEGWGLMDDTTMARGRRVIATVFYTYGAGGQTISRVGVVPSVYEMQRFRTSVLPAQAQSGLSTGVAIVNTSSSSVTLDLQLKDAKGNIIARTTLVLQPGNQTARFIQELFGTAVPAQFRGLLEINSFAEGVVTLGLLVGDGVLTSIPVMHYGSMRSSSMMP